MIDVFLSYARADGSPAAARLRHELTAMTFTVWRDIEEMRAGRDWQAQLFQAIKAVDALLVLLSPGAVASATVAWEWQTALARETPVIPLLIAPCAVPAELQRRHYHDLSDPAAYSLGLARLARDLLELAAVKRAATRPAAPAAEPAAAKYQVGQASHSAIGDNALVVNQGAIVAHLRGQPHEGLSPDQAAELRAILQGLQSRL